MFHSFFILCLIQLLVVVFCQQNQTLTFVNPSAASLTQCATIPIQWNGGAPPFSLTISTVDSPNSTLESAEDTPTVGASPSDWTIDLPSGTSFTILVEDNNGISVQSGVLTVLPSTNTSCLDDSVDGPPPDVSPTPQNHDPANSQTLQAVSQTSVSNPSITASEVQSGSGTPRSSRIAIIAGSIGATVAIITAITISLIIYLKRRRRRNPLTSRENVIITFGNETAGFDGDEDPALIADPFVYKPAVKSEASLNERESRQKTSGSSIPSVQVSANRASKKGETYLPTIRVTPPKDGPSPHMQDDDIDRLAARMVAMMSAGRMSDQAWSPNKIIVDDEDLSAPPMYNEVSRTNQ